MGTSFSRVLPAISNWDHPHAYGDKFIDNSKIAFRRGSSPRVWGQVYIPMIWVLAAGIIPTRMGTSIIMSANVTGKKDHPHAYGDKNYLYRFFCKDMGSSPRVWGQVLIIFRICIILRIIPTRMGTSNLFPTL